jgi:hypothetical protein
LTFKKTFSHIWLINDSVNEETDRNHDKGKNSHQWKNKPGVIRGKNRKHFFGSVLFFFSINVKCEKMRIQKSLRALNLVIE